MISIYLLPDYILKSFKPLANTNITFFMYDNVKFLYKNATTYLV